MVRSTRSRLGQAESRPSRNMLKQRPNRRSPRCFAARKQRGDVQLRGRHAQGLLSGTRQQPIPSKAWHARLPACADLARGERGPLATMAQPTDRLVAIRTPSAPQSRWPIGLPTQDARGRPSAGARDREPLWQHHLGRGIVARRAISAAKAHQPVRIPELLDYLAGQLIRRRLETEADAQVDHDERRLSARREMRRRWRLLRIDPDNLTLVAARRNCAGCGSHSRHAPGRERHAGQERCSAKARWTRPAAPQRVPHGQTQQSDSHPATVRRARLDSGHRHRDVTTVPPQALAMMNSPLVRQLAEKFAKSASKRHRNEPWRSWSPLADYCAGLVAACLRLPSDARPDGWPSFGRQARSAAPTAGRRRRPGSQAWPTIAS